MIIKTLSRKGGSAKQLLNYLFKDEKKLTDEIFKMFFKPMLEDNLGNGKQFDEVINQLLSEVA